MSLLRTMKKEIKVRNKKECDSELYNTLLGSYITTLRMLQRLNVTNQKANNIYKKYKKRALDHKLSDTTWMEDIARELEVEVPYGMMAFCTGKFNMLVVPAEIKDDKITIYTIRPDGEWTRTLIEAQRSGNIYMIEKEI